MSQNASDLTHSLPSHNNNPLYQALLLNRHEECLECIAQHPQYVDDILKGIFPDEGNLLCNTLVSLCLSIIAKYSHTNQRALTLLGTLIPHSAKLTDTDFNSLVLHSLHWVDKLTELNSYNVARNICLAIVKPLRAANPRTLYHRRCLSTLYLQNAYCELVLNPSKRPDSLEWAFSNGIAAKDFGGEGLYGPSLRVYSRLLCTLQNEAPDSRLSTGFYDLAQSALASLIAQAEVPRTALFEWFRLIESTLKSTRPLVSIVPLIEHFDRAIPNPTLTHRTILAGVLAYLINSMHTSTATTPEQQQTEVNSFVLLLSLFNIDLNEDFEGGIELNYSLLSRAFHSKNSLHFAKALIEQGAQYDILVPTVHNQEVSLLSLVSGVGNLPGVQMLMDLGVDPNSLPSALICALISNQRQVALYLANHPRVDPHSRQRRATPLSLAVLSGHTDVAKILVERGAETRVWLLSKKGEMQSLTQIAVQQGHIEMFRYLFSIRDKSKQSDPIKELKSLRRFASQETMRIAIDQTMQQFDVREMIRKNDVDALRNPVKKAVFLDPESRDYQTGNYPIHLATSLHRPRVLKCLLSDLKVPVNSLNHCGETALHIACKTNAYELISLLCEHQADPSLKNRDGKTPLDLCDAKGRQRILKEKPVVSDKPKVEPAAFVMKEEKPTKPLRAPRQGPTKQEQTQAIAAKCNRTKAPPVKQKTAPPPVHLVPQVPVEPDEDENLGINMQVMVDNLVDDDSESLSPRM